MDVLKAVPPLDKAEALVLSWYSESIDICSITDIPIVI